MNATKSLASWAMCGLLCAGAAQGAAVSAEVAKTVAQEQVESFFPGEGWMVADCVEIGDGEGGTAAWGFVFALSESPHAAEGAVRAAVAAGEKGDDGESDLYVETATVVTGGNDTDNLVFRTFRGLADWYIDWAAAGGAGEVIRVGAGDIRFAAAAPAGARGPGKIAAMRRAVAERKARQAEEREALPDDLKELAAQGEAEAEAAAKGRWAAAAEATRHAERKAALKAAGLAE